MPARKIERMNMHVKESSYFILLLRRQLGNLLEIVTATYNLLTIEDVYFWHAIWISSSDYKAAIFDEYNVAQTLCKPFLR